MMWFAEPLLCGLLDLLYELDQTVVPPITLGGGFGLYLKRDYRQRSEERLLFDELPVSRATNDLDLFLGAEVVGAKDSFNTIAKAVRALGYQPASGREYYQWRRSTEVFGHTQDLTLDVLVGPFGSHANRIKQESGKNPRRARPKLGNGDFRAHPTPEALGIDEAPIAIPIRGKRSNGAEYQTQVFVPEAFPYLLMKLFAFRDLKDHEEKDMGRHHALDLYVIVGMMTEAEYGCARELREIYKKDKHFAEAREIVREYFSTERALGGLRLAEHRLFRPEFQMAKFRDVLGELTGGT